MLDKVFGHHATDISLNDRFTMLAAAPPPKPARPRRRSVGSFGPFFDPRLNFHNRNLIEQIARRLQLQAKRKSLRQRLGVPQGALRRFGSESSLPGTRRAGSYGNLSQQRGNWRSSNGNIRGSNGNLSRASSFSNLSQAGGRGRGRGSGRVMQRGVKRRGVGNRPARGATSGGGAGRVTRSQARGGAAARRGRGAVRARGARRGGINRQAVSQALPSREELDHQLDEYMASSKSVLDKELDSYMKTAMETEEQL